MIHFGMNHHHELQPLIEQIKKEVQTVQISQQIQDILEYPQDLKLQLRKITDFKEDQEGYQYQLH